MAQLRPVFLLFLAACGGPDVEGVWVGDCAISSFGQSTEMAMQLDLDPADGEDVTGVGFLEDAQFPGELPVTIEGTLDKRTLDIALITELPTLPTGTASTTSTTSTGTPIEGIDDLLPTFGIEAKVKGDTMEGECTVTVMGFSLGADIVLERKQP